MKAENRVTVHYIHERCQIDDIAVTLNKDPPATKGQRGEITKASLRLDSSFVHSLGEGIDKCIVGDGGACDCVQIYCLLFDSILYQRI